MVNIYRLLLCVGLGMLAVGCGNKSQFEVLEHLDSLPLLTGHQILENHPLKYTEDIELARNSLLVSNFNWQTLYTSIDINGCRSDINFGFLGHGPNEFMDMRTIAYNTADSVLYVHDSSIRRALFYKIDPDSITFSDQNLVKMIPLTSSRVYDTQPTHYGIVAHSVTDGKMFVAIGFDGEINYSFGVFPGDKSDIDDPIVYAMTHQPLLRTSPDGKHFVAAGRTAEWLAFYALNDSSASLITEYFGGESPLSVSVENSGDNKIVSIDDNPETKNSFYELDSTDRYLYATYLGLSRKERQEKIDNGETIWYYVLRFTWDGEYEDGYALDDKILSLAVAPDDTYIIAAIEADNGDCIIKKYPLP